MSTTEMKPSAAYAIVKQHALDERVSYDLLVTLSDKPWDDICSLLHIEKTDKERITPEQGKKVVSVLVDFESGGSR